MTIKKNAGKKKNEWFNNLVANEAFKKFVDDEAFKLLIGGRAMPSVPEFEVAVLGALMMDKTAINIVKPILKPDHFYDDRNKILYQACLNLHQTKRPIDQLLVKEELETMTMLKEAGGIGYLIELTNSVASAANIEYHALVIHEQYLRREAIFLSMIAQQKLFDKSYNPFELRNELSQQMRVQSYNSLMRVRSMSQALEDAKGQPELIQLAGALIRQTEIAILFADTGVGKSILGIQIADAVSKGENLFNTILVNESESQKVLYFDFELSDKQREKRYKHDVLDEYYEFSPNLYIADFNPKFVDFDQRLDRLIADEIESLCEIHKPQFLIVDNITYLTAESSQDTQIAMDLMKRLRAFKVKYNLTILVLAHTPKRNKVMPITKSDLAGSKHLSNFAQSVFAVGESVIDPNVRYIIQVKASNGTVYTQDNVIVCQVLQDGFNHMLRYEFIEMGRERSHLADFADSDTQDSLVRSALDMRQNNGWSWEKIKKELNVPWTSQHLSRLVRQMEQGVQQHEFQQPESVTDNGNPPI